MHIDQHIDQKEQSLSTSVRLSALAAAIALVPAASLATELEEVVVTAQKRSQSAQDIGVAISAMTGDQLKALNMETATDVANQVPSLDIKNTLGVTNPVVTIRGVGLNDFHANNSQSAGVYVDEVFLSAPAMIGFQLFDLERVEVLKGPQGTLYGRNTTAGAVNFISNKPSDETEASVTLGVSKYQTYETEGYISGPLAEGLVGRLAVKYSDRQGGHIINTHTGNSDYGAYDSLAWRGLLSWDVSEAVDVTLNLHGGETKGDAGTTWKAFGVSVADPLDFSECSAFVNTGFSGPGCFDWAGYADPDPDNPYKGAWNMDPQMDVDSKGGSLNINADLGFATLTSISGYESVIRDMEEDAGGSPDRESDIFYHNENSLFSQELRLTSNSDGDFNWIFGVFYASEEAIGDPNQYIQSRATLNTDFTVAWEQETTSWASFLHTEWQFAETLKLTAGLRYTEEEKDFKGFTRDDNPFNDSWYLGFVVVDDLGNPIFDPAAGSVVLGQTDDTFTDDNVSGKLGLDWTPTEDLLIYGSISRGFKSGGFSGAWAGSDAELLPYDSEQITAYELGVKSTLLDNTLQLNASVFSYDYENLQLFTTPENSLALIALTNADEASISGAEVEVWWVPADGLDIRAGASFLDTENDDEQFKGLELPNAPAYSFNLSVRYEWNLREGMTAAVLLAGTYQDDIYKQVENRPFHKVDAYGLINARASINMGEQWELAIWGENLTDEEYVAEVFDQTSIQGNYIVSYGTPIDYGMSLTYNW